MQVVQASVTGLEPKTPYARAIDLGGDDQDRDPGAMSDINGKGLAFVRGAGQFGDR